MVAERELDYPKNLLTRASGSARWQQGNTDVLAAVHGPQPALQRKAQADRAVVEVVLRPYSGMPGNRHHLYETVIRQTVEACAILSPLPQSSISIVLQVVRSDGGMLACALNATCAALMDAGIPLQFPFVAINCAVGVDDAVLHPDAAAEQAADATLTAAFGSQLPESTAEGQRLGLIASQLDGRVGPVQYMAALEMCRGAVPDVVQRHRRAIEQTRVVL